MRRRDLMIGGLMAVGGSPLLARGPAGTNRMCPMCSLSFPRSAVQSNLDHDYVIRSFFFQKTIKNLMETHSS
jgi:hypothetical protein